jgi:hypothetical protein
MIPTKPMSASPAADISYEFLQQPPRQSLSVVI